MKTIETHEISLVYQPVREEITIFCGAKFVATATNPKFKIDLNPHGQEKIIEIKTSSITSDNQIFDYRLDNNVSGQIKTKDEVCKKALKVIAKNNLNFNGKGDTDKIDLYIINDTLNHLYLNKTKDYILIHALRIINESDILYLVRNKPIYIKEEIANFRFEDKILHINTSTSAHQFLFDTNETVIELLKLFLKK